jgi:hypothetical protein
MVSDSPIRDLVDGILYHSIATALRILTLIENRRPKNLKVVFYRFIFKVAGIFVAIRFID